MKSLIDSKDIAFVSSFSSENAAETTGTVLIMFEFVSLDQKGKGN
ncbi:MAG TPA: hypothetical protein VFV86_03775 [Nitrososphaeraceae archaeon]|nr:hypothetical protein [Nitrososphaeraceae archaeon]